MATDYSQYNWDSGGMGPDELDGFRDNIINTFLQKASSAINAEQDPAKKARMEAALEGRVNAISGAFDKYGPTAFMPKKAEEHPEDSILDVPNYMPSNPTGDLPYSPYDPNKLAQKQVQNGSGLLAMMNASTSSILGNNAFGSTASRWDNLSPQEKEFMYESGNAPDLAPSKSGLLGKIASFADSAEKNPEEVGMAIGTRYTPTGLLAPIASGAAGIAKGSYDFTRNAIADSVNAITPGAIQKTDPLEDAADTVESVGKYLSPELKSEAAKTVAAPMDKAMEYLGEASDYTGQKVSDVTGSPALGALAAGAVNLGALALTDKVARGGYSAAQSLMRGKTPVDLPPELASDPDIMQGVKEGISNTIEKNPDLYKTSNEPVTLYSGKPENVPKPSTTIPYPEWKDLETPKATEINVDTTSDLKKNRDIEQAYQNKAADETAVKNLIPDILDELSPKAPVEDTLPTASDLASKGPAPTNNAFASNPELKSLYDDLTLQRAKEQATMPEDPNVTLTTNKDPIDSKPRTMFRYKGEPEAPVELDLQGTSKPAPTENLEAPKTTIPLEQQSKGDLHQSLKDWVNSDTSTQGARPVASAISGNESGQSNALAGRVEPTKDMPSSVADHFNNGTATAGTILDAAADNHGNRFQHAPIVQAVAKSLRSAAKWLGGDKTKIEVIHPTDETARTPEHQQFIKDFNDYAKRHNEEPWEKVRGAYDPKTGKIFINGNGNLTMRTLLHESVHAVAHAAIEAGNQGTLTGVRLRAYKALDSLFEGIKPLLEERSKEYLRNLKAGGVDAQSLRNAYHGRTYGLTNLHEFVSELFSSQEFATSLKGLSRDDILAASKTAKDGGLFRMGLAKVTNAYQAVLKHLSRLIGGADTKALGTNVSMENAYDMMLSGTHDFFKTFEGLDEKHPENPNVVRKSFIGKDYAEPTARKGNVFEADSNPLKGNKFLRDAKDILRRGIFGDRLTDFGRAIGTAKEEYSGAVAESLRLTGQVRDSLKAAMQKDKIANPEAVLDYIHGIHDEDPKVAAEARSALNDAPATKALVDNTILPKLLSNEKELVRSIANMPNPTKADLLLAHTIKNNPGYTMRQYNTASFSKNVVKTGLDGIEAIKKGKDVSPEVQRAVDITNNTLKWIEDNVLPNEGTSKKNLSSLRTNAKSLGIDTVRTLSGVKGRDAKRQALIKAINDAVPDAATAENTKQRLLYEIAAITNSRKSPVASYLRGARLGDITKMRKEVPQALRDLWGELKDPVNVLTSTFLKQDRAIAQYKQQYAIRDALLDKYAFDSKTKAPSFATEQLTGRQMGPLRGMWVPPRIANMLEASLSLDTASKSLHEAFMSNSPVSNTYRWAANLFPAIVPKMVGRLKLFQYATDPGMYVMFVSGNPSILLQNGVIDPRYFARGLAAKLGEMSPKLLASIKQASPELGQMIERDISSVSKSGMGDLMMAGEMYDQILADKLKEAFSSGSFRSIADTIKHAMSLLGTKAQNLAGGALGLTDTPARYAALFHREDILSNHYKKLGVEKSPEEIRKEASDYVKDTTATHSRASLIPQITERTGFSRGAVYNIETVRNAINSMAKGYGDLIEGIKTGDQIFAMHGFKQLVGSAGSVVYMGKLLSAIGGASLAALGMVSNAISPTDPRQKYLQQDKSFFHGERVEEILDPNNTDGSKGTKYFWAPGDRNDYNYGLAQLVHNLQDAWEKHEAGQPIDPAELASSAFGGFIHSFVSSALSSKITNLIMAKAPGWERNEAPKHLQDSVAFWQNTLGLTPEGATRMVALMDVGTPGLAKNMSISSEANASPAMKTLLSLGLGIKPIKADTGLVAPTGQSSTSTITKASLNDASSVLTKTLLNPAAVSNDTIDSMYKKAFKASYEAMTKLNNAYDFGRANGISEGSLMTNSVRGGTPEKAVIATMYQKQNPAYYLYQSLSGSMKNELKRADPSDYSSIIQRYTNRQRHLLDLTLQYSKLTPEQIKEL